MARTPAPKIDPRDPSLGRIKDFLLWVYEAIVALQASSGAAHASTHIHDGSDQIDGDQIDVDYSATNYTPATGALTTSSDQLSSHLKGIDIKIGSIDTGLSGAISDIATLDTSVTTLQSQIGCVYQFMQQGGDGSSTTRRMWFGYVPSTNWTSAAGKKNRVFIPYAGTLKRLLTQNPSPSSGGTETITYVVIKSTDGGTTWSDTALTTATTASDETVQTDDQSVSVSAGDFIGVEIRYSGNVTAIGNDDSCVAAVWFEKS